MARLYDTGIFSVNSSAGAIGVGYKLNFYITGTSTRKNTYPTKADAIAGTNANANPVVAAADGRWPPIWLTGGDYKVVLADFDDVTLETRDPGESAGDAASLEFSHDTSYAAGTVGAKLDRIYDPMDAPYNATGDGVADDTAEVQAAWTGAAGGPIMLGAGTSYVFSGRFDGTAGDIAASSSYTAYSPLKPGVIGRHYHYYEPQYDLSSNVLSVMHYFRTGTITIPAGKQHNVMRFDGVITNGDKFKGIDWNYTVTNSDDAYCAIGLITNKGAGPTKALYGRTQASTGCTGVLVGVVAATTVDSGVTPSFAMGVQISMDGTGSATAGNNIGIRIDTAETTKNLDYGILSQDKIGYAQAFIRGQRANSQTGDAFRWVDSATGRTLYKVAENGSIELGSTSDAQKSIRLSSGATNYLLQGVTTGDLFRIQDNTVGRNLIECYGGAGGATNGVGIWVGGAMEILEVGANDSGGAGYRMVRVLN